jgi:hypothetical protein
VGCSAVKKKEEFARNMKNLKYGKRIIRPVKGEY